MAAMMVGDHMTLSRSILCSTIERDRDRERERERERDRKKDRERQ